MTKQELLDFLKEVDCNTEILLWNSVVGDWQEVEVAHVVYKSKTTIDEFREISDMRSKRDGEESLTEEEVKKSYEDLEYGIAAEPPEEGVEFSKAVLIAPKPRELVSESRDVSISY